MNNKHSKKTLALICTAALTMAACATDGGPNRTAVGAGIGALAGGIIGKQIDGEAGTYIGAIAGALSGGAVGRYVDNQQRDLEEQLASEQAANEIRIQRLADDSLKLDLSNNVSFDVNSSQIKSGFYGSLNKIANVLDKYPHTVVHITGYTDSTGAADYNQKLSVDRAFNVEQYFVSEGVDMRRIIADGRGEDGPVASNTTAQGRAMNRRVEIVLTPIVQGQEERAFTS